MSLIVEIYTAPLCNFCTKAKDLLNSKGITFEEIKLEKDPQKRFEMHKRTNGRTSVPQIFINNQYVGGFVELNHLEILGKLDKILNQ